MSTGYVSHWPKAAVPRSPDGRNNEKLTVIVKISRGRSVYMVHGHFGTEQHMGRPICSPFFMGLTAM